MWHKPHTAIVLGDQPMSVAHVTCGYKIKLNLNCLFLTMSDMISPTELEKTKKDLAALKEQAAGLTREYDRLLEEHSKAQVGGEGRVYYLKTSTRKVLIWRTTLPSLPSFSVS